MKVGDNLGGYARQGTHCFFFFFSTSKAFIIFSYNKNYFLREHKLRAVLGTA